MSKPIFNYPPSVSVLQQLVRPALLFDNILTVLKAVRLWVILNNLYLPNPEFKNDCFDLKEWQNFFFDDATKTHPRSSQPKHQSSQCRCSKTIKELLFSSVDADEKWKEWKKSFIHFSKYFRDTIEDVNNLEPKKPFFITGVTTENDFKFLAKNKWLEEIGTNKYKKVSTLPEITLETSNDGLSSSIETEIEYHFLRGDSASFAYIFSKPINGIQRFFIHSDYDIPSSAIKKISSIQRQLRKIWEQNTVLPIEITYNSSSSGNKYSGIVYPVCIYFYQRTFYLCAFGQTKNPDEINWYNYRIDNIEKIKQLDWNNSEIPTELREKCLNNIENAEDELVDLLVEEIQEELDYAYGFDFYQPDDLMLLRFNADFYQRYIKNTVRHSSFRKIDELKQVYSLIETKCKPDEHKKQLVKIVANYQNDAYYTLRYRKNENSVIMRLRAWSPNVEVLLPWDLRQRMKEDMTKTWQMYQEEQ